MWDKSLSNSLWVLLTSGRFLGLRSLLKVATSLDRGETPARQAWPDGTTVPDALLSVLMFGRACD